MEFSQHSANISSSLFSPPVPFWWQPSQHAHFNGFWFPGSDNLRRTLKVVDNFKPQSRDVILASFPKTGTTWLKSLLYSITHSSSLDSLNHNHPHLLVPSLELLVFATNSAGPAAQSDQPGGTRIFNTHIPYQVLSGNLNSSDCKILRGSGKNSTITMPAMADETETKISDDGEEGIVEKDAKVLNFLDSLDSYLILMDTLSSTLRQGCLELASARLSMGASRINSSLLNLKPHSAATTLEIDHLEGSRMEQVHFRLCKWASSASPQSSPKEGKFDEDELLHRKSYNQESTHHGDDSEAQGKKQENNSQRAVDDQAQRERRKKLSMFGMLVSPKLRSTQLSYETALDTIIEIANMRTSLLHAYNQVAEDMKTTPND